MDGENNEKPYFLMDDLGVPLFLETPIWISGFLFDFKVDFFLYGFITMTNHHHFK